MGFTAGGTPSGTKTNRTTGTLTKAYIGTNEVAGSNVSLNFGNFSAGSSALMIAFLVGRCDSGSAMSSVSIGGSAATFLDLTAIMGISTNQTRVIAWRQVSSGANNVTFTPAGATGTNSAFAVDVWTLTGNISDTPYFYDADFVSADPMAKSFTVAPKSIYIVDAFTGGTGDITVTSFSTATAEAADDEIGTSGRHRRVASYANTTDSSLEITESVDFSANTSTNILYAGWV